MLDNLIIADKSTLNETTWSQVCRVLDLAFGEYVSVKDSEPLPVGDLPKKLESSLRDAIQTIRIEPAFEPDHQHLVYITMEQVARDLDEVLSNAMLADDFKLLAEQSDYTDAGYGEAEALYACQDLGVYLHAWMPEYCDDEYDATLTVSLDIRPQEERQEAEAEQIDTINDSLVRRVKDALKTPSGQRLALAAKLRDLAEQVEASAADSEPCPV